MQDTYTKAELVEKFKAMKKQEVGLARNYTKTGECAAAEWHLSRVSLLKDLIALTEAGAL